MSPRNLRRLDLSVGFLNFRSLATFSLRGLIPSAEISWPRNFTHVEKKVLFVGFT